MIGFWYGKKRICHFRIFLIGIIIIHIFLRDQILNIRGISEIIQKTGKNFDLTVHSLSCLLQDGGHVLHLFFIEQAAHTVMAVPYQQDHGSQACSHKKNN